MLSFLLTDALYWESARVMQPEATIGLAGSCMGFASKRHALRSSGA